MEEFAVFANGRMMQNIRPDEGGSRLLAAFMGGGLDAGMSPNAKVIVEGVANPLAHWMMYFNDPFYVGMHPFAAVEQRRNCVLPRRLLRCGGRRLHRGDRQ